MVVELNSDVISGQVGPVAADSENCTKFVENLVFVADFPKTNKVVTESFEDVISEIYSKLLISLMSPLGRVSLFNRNFDNCLLTKKLSVK
jgi:hypothetical protein